MGLGVTCTGLQVNCCFCNQFFICAGVLVEMLTASMTLR